MESLLSAGDDAASHFLQESEDRATLPAGTKLAHYEVQSLLGAGGSSSFPITFTGTYSVQPNCTGSLTVNAGASGIIHRNLVIVEDGNEVEFVSTDPGLVIAGYMKKQRGDRK